MKKHWKKVLAVFVAILVIVGGYLIYILHFKEYDVADKEVTEITKETYTLELPDGTVIELDEEGNIVESDDSDTNSNSTDGSTTSTNGNGDSGTSTGDGSTSDSDSSTGSASGESSNSGSSSDKGSNGSSSNTGGSTGGSSNGSGSSNEGSTGSNPNGSESTNVTVASIKDKYSPTMSSLQEQANGRINSLVGRAVEEYQTKKANGESVDYGYFYNKYTSAAAELEGRTDKVFYQVVGIIEKELVANGFSKTHAQSIVNDYEAAKEARRSALIDKAMNR